MFTVKCGYILYQDSSKGNIAIKTLIVITKRVNPNDLRDSGYSFF